MLNGSASYLTGCSGRRTGNRTASDQRGRALKHHEHVSELLVQFGFPMGGFAMWDLAGLDLGWVKEESKGEQSALALAFRERTDGLWKQIFEKSSSED